MITLEQVRLLDQKVNQAVELISSLKSENQMLKDKLESYQQKISELEVLLSGLKEDQSEVEMGFRKALDTLSEIENAESSSDAVENTDEELDSVEEEIEESVESDTIAESSLEEAEAGSESENAELDIF